MVRTSDDAPAVTPERTRLRNRAVLHTRAGGLWVAAVAFAVVLLALLVFMLQNGQRTEVSFLGARGHLPLGVALALAAVFGVLLVALPGTARIVQLRMLSRRERTAERRATPAVAAQEDRS
jgi:uncharacterized integral membrane protein